MTLGDGSVWSRRFDAASRLVEQTMPSGARIAFDYSAGATGPDRFTSVAPAGVDPVPAHEFAYDPLERLVRAENPSGVIERHYDSLDRLTEEASHGSSVRFAHDDVANAIDLVFPDGRCERTALDAGGRPTQVTLLTPGAMGGVAGTTLLDIKYAGLLRPTQFVHENGVQAALAYDDAARLIRVDITRGAALIDSARSQHDARSRRALTQFLGVPARNTLHSFDARDRLRNARSGFTLAPLPDEPLPAVQASATTTVAATVVGGATRSESYQLDAADSRLQHSVTGAGAAVNAYSLAPGHRIASVGGQPIAYHPDGHRASDERFHYDVDALGRVVRVRDAATGAVRAELTYDAMSRVATGSMDSTPFARWFAGASWVHEVRGPAATVRQVSPHPLWPLPLCVIDSDGTSFLHSDGSLSTLCATDDAGDVRQRHRYGPFGEPELYANDGTPIASALAVEPTWRGMTLHADLDLYSTSSRLYDPALGVFLARDPMLYIDSPSPYVFASHNPVDFADPAGLGKSPLGEAPRTDAYSSQFPGLTTKEEWDEAFKNMGGPKQEKRKGEKVLETVQAAVATSLALLSPTGLLDIGTGGAVSNLKRRILKGIGFSETDMTSLDLLMMTEGQGAMQAAGETGLGLRAWFGSGLAKKQALGPVSTSVFLLMGAAPVSGGGGGGSGGGSPSLRARGPRATVSVAEAIANLDPSRRQTVALIETEGATLVGAQPDLSPLQKFESQSYWNVIPVPDQPGLHAEATVLMGAGNFGLTPTRGVASNRVCWHCEEMYIRGMGAGRVLQNQRNFVFNPELASRRILVHDPSVPDLSERSLWFWLQL